MARFFSVWRVRAFRVRRSACGCAALDRRICRIASMYCLFSTLTGFLLMLTKRQSSMTIVNCHQNFHQRRFGFV